MSYISLRGTSTAARTTRIRQLYITPLWVDFPCSVSPQLELCRCHNGRRRKHLAESFPKTYRSVLALAPSWLSNNRGWRPPQTGVICTVVCGYCCSSFGTSTGFLASHRLSKSHAICIFCGFEVFVLAPGGKHLQTPWKPLRLWNSRRAHCVYTWYLDRLPSRHHYCCIISIRYLVYVWIQALQYIWAGAITEAHRGAD